MAYEPIFNIEGNLLADPELRFTPNGVAVCNFRVGINDARPDQNNGKTVPALTADVSVWRDMAEHAAESLAKGTRITAKVKMAELGAYIPRNGGDPVGTLKVEALELGPSLRWAEAKVTKVAGQNRGGGGQQNHQGNQGGNWGGGQQNHQGNQGGGWGGGQQNQGGGDPWANGNNPSQQGGGNQGGGWGSDQGWGNGDGQQGGDPWGK